MSTAGAAYAGNVADIIQSGGTNSGNIDQHTGNSNTSKFKQTGNNNTASVVQNGNSNVAGRTNGSAPLFGRMWQDGNSNSIDILQTGNANGIVQHKGVSPDGNPYNDGNFYQEGDRNQAKITQHGGSGQSNGVDEINQIANHGGGSPTNKLTILQQGASSGAYGADVVQPSDYSFAWNFISTVNQTNTGGPTNTLTLTQKGGIYDRENKIARADQNGTGNTGSVSQNGYLNYTGTFSQTGSNNDADITLRGKRNGSAVASAYPPRTLGAGLFSATSPANASMSGAAAGVAGVVQGNATQNGTGNDLSYSAVGDDNLYGFSQTGPGYNSINGTTSGNANEAAVGQDGTGNVTDFSQSGDSNDLGVSITGNNNGVGSFRGTSDIGLNNGQVIQSGGTNYASIEIGGNDANYAVKQTNGGNTAKLSMTGGNSNNVALLQAGNDMASITIVGGQNVMGVKQIGNGTGGNSLTATINGNLNNWSGGFSGFASGIGLTPGSILQNNNGIAGTNNIDLTVETSSNLFAMKQIGSNNTITGTVDTGNGNQVAVAQIGTTNMASFHQSGGGNNIGISQ